MKILIPQNLNGATIMRRSGYGLINGHDGQSFVRHLGRFDYPRFHAYLEGENINLHLDQKKASYTGAHAHSGEYDGDVLAQEAQRIKSVIDQLQNQIQNPPPEKDIFSNKDEKGFWGKLFG